ncbi:hypothetical protein BGW36DRAFT_372532 [Talaromyces proteolyticus]|uniref:Uncharacterized protein n=1 Tax=Talaromyces proteolyticus TaxID=1131652 RepID=A0AAD4PZ64_9EURO|nr:uncharacterized protein BGW36DRAFT_372532 [Talaromyces proteolyticus]KAH8702290.1 hypothetical protein BGW36DRAFT_372532 [Talaromyces proteolyticus]
MASPLVLPLKLDAFVLNPSACDGEDADKAKIAPLVQPNYSHLRLKDPRLQDYRTLQNDVMRLTELHAAAPASKNLRVTNVGGPVDQDNTRTERLGVYLHWMIPRVYRSGAAATNNDNTRSRKRRGLTPHLGLHQDSDPAAPTFPETPNRWLVVRKLHDGYKPETADMAKVTAWVVASDWMHKIDEFDDTEVPKPYDIEATFSPYIDTSSQAEGGTPSIQDQAEIFIGERRKASEWQESDNNGNSVSLGVLNSSNQLFADYQPHNINVFSMLDNFEIKDGAECLTSATADYYVLGWQSTPAKDILHMERDAGTRGERLDALSLALHQADRDDVPEAVKEWLKDETSARVLCHGAMYNVNWHREWDEATRPHIPADDVAGAFQEKMPIAVGTTPLDSLLSYVSGHQEGIEHTLDQLNDLLRAQSENIEDRRAASDEVQNYNFSHFAGGSRYVLQIDERNPAAAPEQEDADLLAELNESQALFDATTRQIELLQWELFSVWWKFSTDSDRSDEDADGAYKATVEDLKTRIGQLLSLQEQQQIRLDEGKDEIEKRDLSLKEAITPQFNQQFDPTLFVGNVQSGWPLDYLNPLKVRLDFQIPSYESRLRARDDEDNYGLHSLPDDLQRTASLLIDEFLHYAESNEENGDSDDDEDEETAPPLYHDDDRDQWKNQQPWFPLFLEWEAEYYHIDYAKWEMEESTSWGSKDKRFRYVIRQEDSENQQLPPLWEQEIEDRRTVSGRILLLPQPVFSLQAELMQLFDSVPENQMPLTPEEQEQLLKDIIGLPFVSAPLDGFTNHLLTLNEGSHLKPNVRVPGAQPMPLEEAYEDSQTIGINAGEVTLMGMETDLTPYASLTRIPPSEYSAFKPVTHGQFKFTKLNIIDKFGQAACVIDPRRFATGPPPVFPCISEYYQPQIYKSKLADLLPNVVEKPENDGKNEFVQMPPAMNQPSRLHMDFVTFDNSDGDNDWRPVTEWENPIWGWVLVNYVDYGVQFFLHDGTFYREVRVAAPNNPEGTVAMDKWLPFKPPKGSHVPRQMDHLIDQFTGSEKAREYLLAFMNLINRATENSRSVPGAYSECVNSLIGRPLALVNVGLSLELATDIKKNQSTQGNQPNIKPPYSLLPPSDNDSGDGGDGEEPEEPTIQYKFPIKLGDVDRPHDGLVGYFHARASPEEENGLEVGDLYTPLPPNEKYPTSQIHQVDKADFPRLKAFWLNPADYGHTNKASKAARSFIVDRNNMLTTFGFIMDPFAPVNAYSSVLPNEKLSLPPWTWESALKSMTAFFHFGPLVVTDDVAGFDADKQLEYDYKLSDERQQMAGTVKLPSLAVAEWSWLQPYPDSANSATSRNTNYNDGDDEDTEKYMAFSVGKIDPVPTWEKGPLTAIEGFLQMTKSVTKPDSEEHDTK